MYAEPEQILAEYESRPRALSPEFIGSLDWNGIKNEALDAKTVRVLTYMRNIESLTDVYFDELRRTPTYRDPEVRHFMERWHEEELQHGELLNRFLAEAGHESPADWSRDLKKQVPRRYRMESYLTSAVANLFGKHFSATHLLWGAINEMSTLQAYRRMTQVNAHPVLQNLLRAIMQEEAIHIYFYFNLAAFRLKSSGTARRLAKWVIDRFWQPVGNGIRPAAETAEVLRLLFGETQARTFLIGHIEERVGKLPGFSGFASVGRRLETWIRGDDRVMTVA